ncbi:B12-binding domain-containing radical SAM protein [Roseivirga sp. E12]|uniref:B12-binding domain-containing radical SAM protein n=1 Tax=Roseivirga sp. E12 TaxID=2819237 RepID=UPI001ABCFCBC|nr:radical SAM protein [Roseivirga sp. E12]MBO3699320.1 B12-binding domain-containing radical SAM protein [Roseivirga sp. E12]
MSVLLTHGYFIADDEKEQQIMRPYPPLGLLYISAFLNQQEIENKVFDSTFSDMQSLFEQIRTEKPKILAIYANLMTKLNVLEIAKVCKKLSPNTSVVMGGPDVTYNAENYLKNGADYIVIGEGENTMFELVEHLQKHPEQPPSDIAGLAYLNSGELTKTAPRTKVRDINELPIPNREAIDIQKYLDAWKSHHGQNALSVSTQRGCPYTCKWCSTAVYGQSYRRRSPAKVVEELKEIKERYNPDTIWFVDDVFTVSHKWLREFVGALETEGVKIPFECISRADRMNEEVIGLLKKAGCIRVWIGAESGSQKIIDAMDRRVSVDQVRNMIIETRKQGIEAGTFIMLGYPGETEEDIEETINHLKISNPDHFTITVAYPIKGTSLYDEIETKKTIEPEWHLSTDRDIDFERTYSRKYYDYAVVRVISEVNHHKMKLKGKYGLQFFKLGLKSLYAGTMMKWQQNGKKPLSLNRNSR